MIEAVGLTKFYGPHPAIMDVSFDVQEGEVVAFRCTGKRFLPLFLASFVVPSLALKLVPDRWGQ